MADETLIKQITVNGVGHKVDYESLANLPVIPEDKSAEIAALQENIASQKALSIKLAKKAGCEDALAHDLYPELPVITYTVADTLSGAKVLKGNATDAAELEPYEEGKTVVYNKDATRGYTGDLADGDYQFNMSVIAPEGKIAKATTTVEQSETTYNALRATLQDSTTNTWRIQATKVKVDMDISVVQDDPLAVTFINNTDKTLQNAVGSDPVDIIDNTDTAVPEADYKFKVVLDSKATSDEYLTKVLCGEDDITDAVKATEGYIDYKKTGNVYTIPASMVTANLTITIGVATVEETASDAE